MAHSSQTHDAFGREAEGAQLSDHRVGVRQRRDDDIGIGEVARSGDRQAGDALAPLRAVVVECLGQRESSAGQARKQCQALLLRRR